MTLRQRARDLLAQPSAAAILVWLLVVPFVRPFGNYPLNDDWHYARIAKNFALNGRFALDSPVASALVGQSLAVWPIIRIFGFSHTALHVVTALFGLAGIVILDRLMSLATVAPKIRFVALVTLILNPIFFYTTFSFMTEFYGYVPGLLAALIWFKNRRDFNSASARGKPAISWSVAIGCSILFGCTFWVRQFCAAIYPALPGATVIALMASRRWRSLLATLPRLVVSTIFFAAILESFFPWAKATGNFTPQFQSALGSVTKFEGETFFKHSMLWLIYMSLFNAPLLMLAPWRAHAWKWLLATSTILISAAYLGRYMLRTVHMDWVHPHMPFLGNIIEETGLGPITLSDVYWAKMRRPHWQPETWMIAEVFTVHAVALFAPILVGGREIFRKLRGTIAFEVLLYGVLVMLGSLVLSIQAYKMETLDRYHMPSILVMPLVVAIAIRAQRGSGEDDGRDVWSAWQYAVIALAAAPLFWFSIAGLHDYFRWNDARWALVKKAESFGATTSVIEGGYELDGWLHYDDIKNDHPINGCIGGRCRCDYATWYTKDCSYHIGMNAYPGYETITTITPSYWLAPGPPMMLSRRLK